ncbi:coiled-coil domain-containing protein 152 [Microcaecilia unicolor]|uniref:Coiled-coil domain-containing protein 152 n=1 Tax=Microcaecilia unicolor TaxID=1415580 RepID=A0A6P7XB46_9AMPH|nr:coiled-coil domain-containing protein 152 [Microcaecilia unicolor]
MEASTEKVEILNLDKLIVDFSHIEKIPCPQEKTPNVRIFHKEDLPELIFLVASTLCFDDEQPLVPEVCKKIVERNGKINLLEIQLEKSMKMLKLSQTKEASIKEDCDALQTVIKGLQGTIENQCNLRDENEKLKKTMQILEQKLKAQEQEHKNYIDKFVIEMKAKEEDHQMEQRKTQYDMNRKFELKEEEHKKLMNEKDIEILELNRQLRTQEKEKQSEIIKLQIEFNAKLARIQHKTAKSYPDTTGLPQNIYRMKLQHLQEEKNKEIEILRRTIRDLEQQLRNEQGSHLKRKRF